MVSGRVKARPLSSLPPNCPGSRSARRALVKKEMQTRPPSSQACCAERGVAWAPGNGDYSVVPSDLPALLPAARPRSSASRRGTPTRQHNKEQVDISNSVNTMRSGMEKVFQEAGRLRSQCVSPSIEYDVTSVLQDQLREQLGCYGWLAHAISERGTCGAQARVEAARSLHKWQSESARLENVLCGRLELEPHSLGKRATTPIITDVEIEEADLMPESSNQVCACGSIFFSDALFCRRCGNRRPNLLGGRTSVQDVNPTTQVHEPEKRGISAVQLRTFFETFCGDILYEGEEKAKPQCLPSKLAELCVQTNLADAKEGLRMVNEKRETNTYSVNELLIIPQTRDQGISYAEKLNPDGLLINFFLSHHWGEDFGEFTQGVLRHALTCSQAAGKRWKEMAYWCCCFSINQNVPDYWGDFSESPFAVALSSPSCLGTVFNLNHLGSALCRTWCIYEVFLSHKFGKQFFLNSAQGPLRHVSETSRGKDLWVSHIFRLLQHVSTLDADATCEEDRQNIMHIAATSESPDGLSGAKAFDSVLRASVAEQAIFTLCRHGDVAAVRQALDFQADPNAIDSNGLRPLTYAAGKDCLETVLLLKAHGADERAAVAAHSVLGMWAQDPAVRKRCFAAVQGLSHDDFTFHSYAYHRAKMENDVKVGSSFAHNLASDNSDTRLAGVKGLINLGASTAAWYAVELSSCLGDSDPRLRQAAVDAFGAMNELFDFSSSDIIPGSIPMENLEKELFHTGSNVLHTAAKEETGNAFRALIYGVDWPAHARTLRVQDAAGQNIGHLAALNGHVDPLRYLVDGRKMPSTAMMMKDECGRNPLHYAAEKGLAEKFLELFSISGVTLSDLQVKDNNGHSPAHIAARHDHADCLRVMIKDCRFPISSLSACDNAGRNVVHIAAAHGSSDCLRLLIEEMKAPRDILTAGDLWHYTPAHVAVSINSEVSVRALALLKAPMNLPMGPETPGIGSVALVNKYSTGHSMGHSSAGTWRIGRVYHGPDRQGKMKFEYEGGMKSQELVHYNRCVFAPTPMVLAEKLGLETVENVLKAQYHAAAKSLSGKSSTALWRMARRGVLPAGVLASLGQANALRELIEKRQLPRDSLREVDPDGCRPLHRAAASGSAISVQAIVELGGLTDEELGAADSGGRTAIHWAAASNSASCVCAVYKAFGTIGCRDALTCADNWHRTPVHVAAAADAADALIALDDLGAPLEEYMGSPKLESGAVALVQQPDGPARLAVVQRVHTDRTIRVKYDSGVSDGLVSSDRCTFAPTPLQLAEGLNCARTSTLLRKLLGIPLAMPSRRQSIQSNTSRRGSMTSYNTDSLLAWRRGSISSKLGKLDAYLG